MQLRFGIEETVRRSETAARFTWRSLAPAAALSLVFPLVGHAQSGVQLNQNCVVSILNRNVQVAADGSWYLPNVPSNFGPVRARATCVQGGATLFGQSPLFTVVPNGYIDLQNTVQLGNTTPIPTSLTVTAPETTLTSAGATVQLSVTVPGANGNSQDVTAASAGTLYRVSNPALATISADGLVTAQQSGTVLVQATNEGTQGILLLHVLFGGESGGSGTNIPQTPDQLAAALSSIEVKPSSFTLYENPLTVVSEPLQVLGHLSDGQTTIDLTSNALWGTNYTSSDLTVCNFSALDGNIIAGNTGSCTITVTVAGLQAAATGTVTVFTPQAQSWVDIPAGYANGVDASGDYAYVAAGSAGLMVVHAADRAHPSVVADLGLPGNADAVQVVGQLAYVSAGTAGLQIVNISNPLQPTLVSGINTGDDVWKTVVSGGIAYVANGGSGVAMIDVRNPAAPAKLGSLALPGFTKGVAFDSSRKLLVAVGDPGLFTIDVTSPMNPMLLGSLSYLGWYDPRAVVLKGNFAFVGTIYASLTLVDLTNPAAPVLGTSTDPAYGGRLRDLAIVNNFEFGADKYFGTGVPVVDVSAPPALTPRFTLPFEPQRNFYVGGTGIAVDAAYVYLTAENTFADSGVKGVNGQTRLYIGQYTPAQDNNGVPPTAAIATPANGGTFVAGGQVPITVTASDDVAVASVNILVNGQVVYTATSAPYQFNYAVPAGATTLTIGAQAVDFGGNVGTAQPVTLTAVPDGPPTVTIVSPVNGSILDPRGPLAIMVEAGDAVAISQLSITVNGQVVFTTSSGPFQFNYAIAPGATAVIVAQATNPSGLTTATPPVSVTADPPPVIVFDYPRDGGVVSPGSNIPVDADIFDGFSISNTSIACNGHVVYTGRGDWSNGHTHVHYWCPVPTDGTTLTVVVQATNQVGETSSAQAIEFVGRPLSWVDIPGFAHDLAVRGNYAFVAAGPAGLQVVNVGDRSSPAIVASLSLPGDADDVEIVGNLAYVAAGTAGVQIVDITNPLAPALVNGVSTNGEARNLVVRGGTAYVANGAFGIVLVNVNDPAAPAVLGSLPLTGVIKGVDVDISRNLLVAVGDSGLFAVDVTVPSSPALRGSLSWVGDARRVTVKGNFAFVADLQIGLATVDLTDPLAPALGQSTTFPARQQGDFAPPGGLQDVAILGNRAFGAVQQIWNGVPLADVSAPPALPELGSLRFPWADPRNFGNDDATGIFADPFYMYFTAVGGLADDGSVAESRLYIGQYAPIQDTAGVAPTATIVAPVNGATATWGSYLPIVVNASDDVAVAEVDITVNSQTVGQVVRTTGSAPYQYMYQVPPGATGLTIGARAIDFGGNIGTASPVTLVAQADPLTTAQGRVVDSLGNPTGGANVVCQGVAATAAGDGTFSIPGLSTISGPIVCSARATIGSQASSGSSGAVAPVLGGTTNVGTITLQAARSSRGQDFWLIVPDASGCSWSACVPPQIVILGDATANYTVSNTGSDFLATGAVTPASPAIVSVPLSLSVTSDQTVENKGIHVTADADVSVFLNYNNGYFSQMFLGIPSSALGVENFGLNYAGTSELTLVSPQDSTQVTISNACDSDTPYTAALDQGQTYQLQCDDVSGSHVLSDKPVGVVAAAPYAAVPQDFGTQTAIAQMMFPVGALWGTEIYSPPTSLQEFPLYRVLASKDGTTVTVDQGAGRVQTFQLNQGQFRELSFPGSPQNGVRFTSDQPILVMHYGAWYSSDWTWRTNPDPFAMLLIPATNFALSSRFYGPTDSGWQNEALIIAPSGSLSSLQLNGIAVDTSTFVPLPGGRYSAGQIPVAAGQNVITCAQPIAVYSVGYNLSKGGWSYATPTRF